MMFVLATLFVVCIVGCSSAPSSPQKSSVTQENKRSLPKGFLYMDNFRVNKTNGWTSTDTKWTPGFNALTHDTMEGQKDDAIYAPYVLKQKNYSVQILADAIMGDFSIVYLNKERNKGFTFRIRNGLAQFTSAVGDGYETFVSYTLSQGKHKFEMVKTGDTVSFLVDGQYVLSQEPIVSESLKDARFGIWSSEVRVYEVYVKNIE